MALFVNNHTNSKVEQIAVLMPHLYTHKTGGYRIVFRIWFPDGTFKDKTRYAKKKATAQLIYADAETIETLSRKRQIAKDEVTRAINGGYLTPEEAVKLYGCHVAGTKTWAELSKGYEDWALAHCEKTTRTCNIPKLNRVIEFFSRYDPAEVTTEHIEQYIKDRKAGRLKLDPKKRGRKFSDQKGKDATIRKELVILRRLLDPLGKDNNPARKLPLLEVNEEAIPRPLYPDEVKAFLKHLEADKDLLGGWLMHMTMIYLYAGLRPSEIVRLEPDDINLQAEKIHIQGRTKSGYARSVVMHPDLKPYLEDRMKTALKGERLFDCDVNSLGRRIRDLFKKAGLTGVKPYSLRHSFITYLLRAGADLRQTMELAGHRRIATTNRYIHVIPSIDSPVKKIDFTGKKDGKHDSK